MLALNLGVKGLYLLGVEREVQNLLPPGQYGLYFSLFNLSMLLQLLADFGLQLYNSRSLSSHRHLLAKYFPYFLGVKLLLGGVFFLALFTAGYWLGYDQMAFGLLCIVGTNQLLMSLLLFLRSNLTGMGRYRTDSWVSVLDKILMLLFVGALLLLARQQLNVYSFALAQTLSWFISVLIVLGLLRRQLVRWQPKWNIPQYYSLLRNSFPFALAIFLMTAYTRIDAVMIERLLPDGAFQTDHYAAAYRLLDAVNMLAYLISALLLPMFARLLSQGKSPRPLLQLSLPTVLAGALIVSFPIAIWAQPLVYWLYDFADERTGKILALLIFSFAAMSLNYVYGALLGAADELKRMNYIFAAGCLINLLGNWWVLPIYGAVGAAAITTLTQSFIALAQAVLAHRRLALPLGIFPWVNFLLFLLLLLLLNGFLLPLIPIGFLAKIVLSLLLGSVLAFTTGVLRTKEWLELLAKKSKA